MSFLFGKGKGKSSDHYIVKNIKEALNAINKEKVKDKVRKYVNLLYDYFPNIMSEKRNLSRSLSNFIFLNCLSALLFFYNNLFYLYLYLYLFLIHLGF